MTLVWDGDEYIDWEYASNPPGGDGTVTVVDAAIIAYTTDDATSGPLAFDTPGANTGTDITINGAGELVFAVAQRAIISVDLSLVTDVDADGVLVVRAYVSGTALPDVSYLAWGNDRYTVPIIASQTHLQCNVTFPEDVFAAGSIIALQIQHLGAGMVTVEGGATMVYARRTA